MMTDSCGAHIDLYEIGQNINRFADKFQRRTFKRRDQKIRSVRLRELGALFGFTKLPAHALARRGSPSPHSTAAALVTLVAEQPIAQRWF